MSFRKGFSLIEVNMAILIAAGGMLTLFSLFPGGLRQSTQASEDLYQSTYAASAFEAISANAKRIMDITVWNGTSDNDIQTFWKEVTRGTGISSTLGTVTQLSKTSQMYLDLRDGSNPANIRYAGTDIDKSSSSGDILLPEQYLFRIFKIPADTDKGIPARYKISFVCTDQKSPSLFHANPIYSMEFYFMGKPWMVW